MDTLGLFMMYLIIQVSLQVHAKAHFGTITKCVDYASVLIFKYPDKRFQYTNIYRVMHKRFSFSKWDFLA